MKHSIFTDFNRLLMTIFFVASVTACNKEEFYQKDYLENPFADNTVVTGGSNGGDSSGVDGSSQGGVSAGVTSGSTDGTTGGSSTGTTAGGSTTGDSTSGSTAGGSTAGDSTSGSATGGTTTAGSSTGSTAGGSTTGDSTSGSTAGGTTTAGSSTGSTSGGSTTGSTTGGVGDCNNGHGNDADGVDDSNPGRGHGGPNALKNPNVTEVCYKNVEEKFQQSAAQTKKLDIMWVVDNSGSMADEQAALGANFDSFITQFINRNVDFKMGITTTDTSSDAKKGKMVAGSDSKLTSAMAAANPNQFMNDFKALVNVGTRGSGNEMGLMATEGFMEKYADSFIRPDAYLAIVILSDEEDQSPKDVVKYTEHLKSFKANAGLVKIYSIVNAKNVNTGGNTIGHARYEEASDRTAGVMSDIMDNFDDVLLEMGDSIVNLLDSFALAADPVDGTLKVFVNGVESSNYTFDAPSRSIKFTQGNLPPVGAQVTVNYKKVK